MSSLLNIFKKYQNNLTEVDDKKILVVEDDPRFQKIFHAKLSHQYLVTVVDNVEKAELSLAQELPDLILLDVMLPGGKNGYDLLETLKSNQATQNIPVIVLTNLPDNEEKTAHELGASGFFVKSDSKIQDVVTKINSYLQ